MNRPKAVVPSLESQALHIQGPKLLQHLIAAGVFLASAATLSAQWEIEESHTTAGLRGIANVGDEIAWASGTNGTVLRTVDGGSKWQMCPVPLGADKLDFRAIQAFDEKTAIVMSSGKGDLSRLYKTVDGCATWTLVLANPDAAGFWDAFRAADPSTMIILGDPVDGAFQIRETKDGGETWSIERTQPSWLNEGAFAASNSALSINWDEGPAVFGTGSLGGARLFRDECYPCTKHTERWKATEVGVFPWGLSAGIFSIRQSTWDHLVAVGGDYQKPDLQEGTAAWSNDAGRHWHKSDTPPRGYRSAVDYDSVARAWVAVGPNGTDISTDDGRSWYPLKPGPGEPPDANRNWNALSLPFVVGPNGRIGKWKGTETNRRVIPLE